MHIHGAGQCGAHIVVMGDPIPNGEVITISGVGRFGCFTLRGADISLKRFAAVSSRGVDSKTHELHIFPMIIASGPYRNVDAGPVDGSSIQVEGGPWHR